MRDRLIEIFKKTNYKPFEQCNIDANLANQFSNYALNCIVDKLLANGVIVLPCKVGTTIYWVRRVGHGRGYYIVKSKLIFKNLERVLELWGEEVFLTKEEAEQSLASKNDVERKEDEGK